MFYTAFITKVTSSYFPQVVDVGGSMFVHAFGAYFGLAISRVLHNPEVEKSTKEGSVYHSDMFAVVGSSEFNTCFKIILDQLSLYKEMYWYIFYF